MKCHNDTGNCMQRPKCEHSCNVRGSVVFDLEQRGRILMIASERAMARDAALEEAAKYVELAGGWTVAEIAQGLRNRKAVP